MEYPKFYKDGRCFYKVVSKNSTLAVGDYEYAGRNIENHKFVPKMDNPVEITEAEFKAVFNNVVKKLKKLSQ